MAELSIKFEVQDILDRLKREGWVRPVRCKDCALRESCRASIVWAIPPDDDWYCADGERRYLDDN